MKKPKFKIGQVVFNQTEGNYARIETLPDEDYMRYLLSDGTELNEQDLRKLTKKEANP
jgi:hypothetical protein